MDNPCPRCGRGKSFTLNDQLPIQKFDLKCCGGQKVTVKLIKLFHGGAVRSFEWEQVDGKN
jgi:hypothetical protein